MESSVLYIACVFLGAFGAWLVSRFAVKFGLMDIPNERSSHETPVPKGGGVGILAAFVLASTSLGISSSLWLPASSLAFLSFVGDRVEIPPKSRLLVQFISAFFLLYPLLFLDSFPELHLVSSHLFSPSTVLCCLTLSIFIVGTANFYNFMDGINGIAGITGLVAFGLLGLYAFLSGSDPSFVVLSMCMSLACLGFLPFNFPKARVFMGDVGSILLGFVFSGMVVWLARSPVDFVCMAAFVFPFYVDELSTMAVRIMDDSGPVRMKPSKGNDSGRWINRIWLRRLDIITRPHRKHIYQLLANELRIAHWKVSMGYGLVQAVVGTGSLMVKGYGLPVLIASLGICFAGFWGFGTWVRSRVDAPVIHAGYGMERLAGVNSREKKCIDRARRPQRIDRIIDSDIGAKKMTAQPENVER